MVTLKLDILGDWVKARWLPAHPRYVTVATQSVALNVPVLRAFDRALALKGDYTFVEDRQAECPVIVPMEGHDAAACVDSRTGAFVLRFRPAGTSNGRGIVEVLVLCSYYSDGEHMVCIASMPDGFQPTWDSFIHQCWKTLDALRPREQVVVIGGRSDSFEATVNLEDIILPAALKGDLLHDVEAFFTRGVAIYQRLKLKPFRKLLLAGPPGTGKTMLCTALAKWALEREYFVVYVSSADREGAHFWKIQRALHIAANAERPTLILLEELDAYLHKEEKALVLNVLDGSESFDNPLGTLLVATTNYPEAIDERIMKRPGRLDRVFIIPPMKAAEDAEAMLRRYLGDDWQDEHAALAPALVGYSGAFVREVVLHALMTMAFDGMTGLPLALLETSFTTLKAQIEARDAYLRGRALKRTLEEDDDEDESEDEAQVAEPEAAFGD